MHPRYAAVMGVLAALAMALSACAPAAQPKAPPAEAPQAAETAPATEATQPADTPAAPDAAAATVYGDLPRDETFIVGHQVPGSDVWDNFNPFMPGFNSVTGYINTVMELPFYMDDNTVVYPWLAKEWTYSADGKEFTLTIVDNANWNDGTPLTIDDWLFTIDYYIKNADKIGLGVPFKNSVDTVTAEGKDKLVFKLKDTDYRFHSNFVNAFYILSKAVWDGQDPLAFKNPDAIGPGPYTLKSTNPETRVVMWERRDDYWNKDKMPAPKYMVWTQAPKQDLSKLEWEQGSYDLGSLESAPIKQAMEANPAIAQYKGLDPCPRRIALNHTIKPLDDPAFRHALSLLVDRQRAANLGDPPAYPNIVPWPYDPEKGNPPETFYNLADVDKYDIGKFDPAKAAQILDEAGYKLVDGKRVDKEGNPIQLTAITFQGQITHWTAWADIMKEEAEKLGIQIDVQVQEASTFVANLPNGQFEISFFWNCPRADDPIGTYNDLMPENYKPIGTATWQNPYRWTITPALEEVVKKMRVGDPADPAVQELYKQAFALTFQEYVWSPLFGDYFVIPYSNQHWQGYEKANILVYWGPLFRQILTQITPAQ